MANDQLEKLSLWNVERVETFLAQSCVGSDLYQEISGAKISAYFAQRQEKLVLGMEISSDDIYKFWVYVQNFGPTQTISRDISELRHGVFTLGSRFNCARDKRAGQPAGVDTMTPGVGHRAVVIAAEKRAALQNRFSDLVTSYLSLTPIRPSRSAHLLFQVLSSSWKHPTPLSPQQVSTQGKLPRGVSPLHGQVRGLSPDLTKVCSPAWTGRGWALILLRCEPYMDNGEAKPRSLLRCVKLLHGQGEAKPRSYSEGVSPVWTREKLSPDLTKVWSPAWTRRS
ncbi:hypothetical protein RRG08_066463 [Elysia crispata]|uniref:Uncharacterized protein n=1 Tax=Elysia crispata TaxID=231223 RepID=A0AAE0Y2W6_9GAST|nr:hypothetical protein RRG08_066463 [Elysia crispata]